MLAGRCVKIALCGVAVTLTGVILRVVRDSVLSLAHSLSCCAQHIAPKLFQNITLSFALACLLKLYCRYTLLRITYQTIHPTCKAECNECKYSDNVASHSIVVGMCML